MRRQLPLRTPPGGSPDNTPGARKDPLALFTFEVEGVCEAWFRSVGGIKSETEVQEHPEGGYNLGMRKLIGRTKWPNLVLKRGWTGPPYSLWKKREQMLDDSSADGNPNDNDQLFRFQGTIWQTGADLTRICGWKFWNGWICKWEGPDFDAAKNELAIETIEIAHEGLTLITPGMSGT